MKLFDSVAIEQATYTNKELELLLPSIAIEGVVDDIIDRIKSVFTSFTDIFKRLTLTYSIENDEVLNEVIKKAKENLAYIQKYPEQKKIPSVIHDAGRTIMAVPPGFNGDLARYIDVLIVSSEQIHKLCVAEAAAYNSVLSNYITNKNARGNSKEYRAEISIIAKDNEKHTSTIHKFFNYSSKDSGGRMLKELVDSYGDLQKMEDKVEKLAKINNFKNIVNAQNTIAATVDLIDIFMEEAAKDPNTNPGQIKSMALYTSEIAKLYESLTMVRFYSETAIKMYANVVETIRNKM